MNKLNKEQKGATQYTKNVNETVSQNMIQSYLLQEEEDLKAAKAHFVLELGDENITDEEGKILWNRQSQNYLKTVETPETVNPYLWKKVRGDYYAGVLELSKGNAYTVIGVDSATISFVRTRNGWLVLDTGLTTSSAQLALQLVEQAIKEDIHSNIKAVILSHTHVDHFGGLEAFVPSEARPKVEELPVYAPGGYEKSMVDDNLYAGIQTSRRVLYQCGVFLPHEEKGWVSIGLSSASNVLGKISSALPNVPIEEDSTIEIDGIDVSFILTPNTETTAHMCVYFKEYQLLYLGDNSVGTLHNIYTMRGARVRDDNYWGEMFYQLYLKYGEEVQTIYQGHGIPHWKAANRPDNLKIFLLDNATAYKFTHDQALLYANMGYNLNEIGNILEIPDAIKRTWYTRPHYGDYSFNARGIYQKYLGFYDGNPINLLPLPEKVLAAKFIEYVGSPALVLEKALLDYEKGEYQWVATVTNHLVFADPGNLEARYLCADAFEQLAYLTENALFRNAYLSGAIELRNPEFSKNINFYAMNNDEVVPGASTDLLLDHLGVNFDGYKAAEVNVNFILQIVDQTAVSGISKTKYKATESIVTEIHIVSIFKGTIFHHKDASGEKLRENSNLAVITTTKEGVYKLSIKKYTDYKELFETDRRDILDLIDGYVVDINKFRNFNLIEPLTQIIS